MAKDALPAGGGAGSLPQQWWNALIAAGATATQAAGIMGSLQNESGFNPEYNNPAQGVGGIQWIGSYLSMKGFPTPTGNVSQDIVNQVAFLKATGGFAAASGSTAQEAGQNFAENYERCEYCGSGGSQTVARGQNATSWAEVASKSSWNTASQGNVAGTAGASGGAGSPTGTSTADCIIPIPVVGGCLFSKSDGRVLLGGVMMAGAGLIGIAGIVICAMAAGKVVKFPAGKLGGMVGGPAGAIAGIATSGAERHAARSESERQAAGGTAGQRARYRQSVRTWEPSGEEF